MSACTCFSISSYTHSLRNFEKKIERKNITAFLSLAGYLHRKSLTIRYSRPLLDFNTYSLWNLPTVLQNSCAFFKLFELSSASCRYARAVCRAALNLNGADCTILAQSTDGHAIFTLTEQHVRLSTLLRLGQFECFCHCLAIIAMQAHIRSSHTII